MYIGSKIKEYRNKLGLTQKDLADRLHVTYQAVSRWENDAAEPSFDCLLDMTKIFHCTLDDLFGIEKDQDKEMTKTDAEETPASTPVPENKIVEKVIVKESQKMLALCDDCRKAIYDEDDIHHVKTQNGRTHITKVLCSDCYRRFQTEEAEKKAERRKREKADLITRRKRGVIWGTVSALIMLLVSVYCFVQKNNNAGGFFLAAVFLAFTFVGCIFLDNNFIPEMWLTIASWGFVNMPGVIMEFSLGGFIIGLAIKIVLWIIGFLIAILATVFATLLGMVLSIFVYPFALSKNLKGIDNI